MNGKAKLIQLADIRVVDRLRPIDDEHARAIAISIREIGLINAITVRNTPAAKDGKYTLVAGGHRMRAVELCGLQSINAVVIEADALEAEIYEIEENFFRNDLSVIDRGLFGERLRFIWERSGREIRTGRPKNNRPKVGPILEDTLSEFVCNRLRVSKSGAKRLGYIAEWLRPELRDKLRASRYADNESMLLKLAKMPSDKQSMIAQAMQIEPDLKKVLAAIDGHKKEQREQLSAYQKRIAAFRTAWAMFKTDEERAAALAEIGAAIIPLDTPES